MRTVALKHLCTTITRGSAPTYSENGSGSALAVGQSCVRPHGILDTTRGRWHEGPIPSKGRLFGGEVLINSTGTGTLGRVGLLDRPFEHPAFVDGHVTLLRADTRVADGRFLAYALGLPATRQYIEEALSAGATKQRELNLDSLRAHPVVILPRPEQAAVADFLDRECSRIGELSAELSRTDEVIVERLTSEIDACFAPGPGKRERKLHTLLHGRPCYGVLVPQLSDDGVPFVRVGDLHRVAAGHLNGLARIPHRQAREYHRTTLKTGDVLISVVGSIDKAVVVPDALAGANVARAVARLRPAAIPSQFLAMWVKSSSYRVQAHHATSADTAQPTLNMSDLSQFRLAVPETDSDRLLLTHRLDELDRSARLMRRETVGLATCLEQYRDALITEAVTGKLDVTKLSESQMDESLAAVREGERPEVLSS